jgi:tetratricopeptide (TPR) repeat protein
MAPVFGQGGGRRGGGGGGGNNEQSGNDGSGGNNTGGDPYSPSAVAERLLNSDNWSLDSENGIFKWKNSTFDIGNNIIVRARFERYLESPGEADSTAQYQAVLAKIKDLLAVHDDGTNTSKDPTYDAWAMLSDAMKFDEDGGASDTLQRLVFETWQIRDAMDQNQQNFNDLEAQRGDQQETLASQNDATSDDVNMAMNGTNKSGNANTAQQGQNTRNAGGRGGNQNQGSTTGGTTVGTGGASVNGNTTVPNGSSGSAMPNLPTLPGMPATPSLPALANMSRSGYDAYDLARTLAKEGLLETQTAGAGLKAKLQFQTQILAYMMERRFQHALIAGQFYNKIFDGADQGMDIGRAQLAKFIDPSGTAPSVDSLEFIAQEAIADTDTGMKAVDASYDAGERWSSLEMLQQTFLLGEMLPPVQEFDPAKRQVLAGLYRETNDLKHMMDMHDFAAAEATLTKIQADASDFPASPVMSAIREGEQTSNLALLSAEQELMAQDYDDEKDSMEKAIEIWPLNPEIKTFNDQMAQKMNMVTDLTPKFDDLLKEQAYRQIFDQKNDFGMAFLNDPDRANKLRDIVDRVGKIDMLVAYANEALAQGSGYVAWEELANAAKLDPNDPVLTKTQAQVAPQVANFVSVLDAAQRAQQAGEYATSLNDYLAAQDIYPASQLCREGIDNVSKQILAKLNPGGATAQALEAEEAQEAAAQAAANPPTATPATPAAASSTGSSDLTGGAATAPATANTLGPTASTSSPAPANPTPGEALTNPNPNPGSSTSSVSTATMPRTLF